MAAALSDPCTVIATMRDIVVCVWLASSYSGCLVLCAYGLDVMAKRTAALSTGWQCGAFRYQADHDAWICPQDQWLWPQSFDPHNRVMRYRAKPSACNACPVKATCTTSESGREVSRHVDPWPYSEAGRFHRGIACAVTVLAVLVPLANVVGRSGAQAAVLLVVAAAAVVTSWPLWQHLRETPTGFPEHVPVRALPPLVDTGTDADAPTTAPVPRDRFGSRRGSFTDEDAITRKAGWSRVKPS